MKVIWLWVAVCAVAAIATACGGSTSSEATNPATTAAMATETTGAESPNAAGAATITIANMSFGDQVAVPAGAQVSVTNKDSVEHSVTSDTAGQFDVEIDGNEQKTFTAPSQPGEYAFHCKYHASMHGTLIVQ